MLQSLDHWSVHKTDLHYRTWHSPGKVKEQSTHWSLIWICNKWKRINQWHKTHNMIKACTILIIYTCLLSYFRQPVACTWCQRRFIQHCWQPCLKPCYDVQQHNNTCIRKSRGDGKTDGYGGKGATPTFHIKSCYFFHFRMSNSGNMLVTCAFKNLKTHY